MTVRYLQDCKMAIVHSGLLRTLPKSSLRVLLVYLAIARWKDGSFTAGYKATATLGNLCPRDVRKGVNELLRLGIIERIHKGSSYTNRSIYKFNLERINEHGFTRSTNVQETPWDELRSISGDVEIPC
jgi:hypothetical protein